MTELITTLRSTIEARLETARRALDHWEQFKDYGHLRATGHALHPHIAANDPASTIRLHEGLLGLVDFVAHKHEDEPFVGFDRVLVNLAHALGIDTGASRREGACCQAAYDSDGHAHGPACPIYGDGGCE
jgi:hypothetical protein